MTDEQLREREKGLRLNTNELFFLREGYEEGYEAAWQARDAEVQRLERVLSRVQRIVRNWQNDTSQRDYDALDELSTILQAVALAGREATDE